MYWIGRMFKTLLLILLFTFLGVFKGEVAFSQCSMNATPISFGNYDTFSSAPLDAVGTITINCSRNVRRATVTLSANISMYGRIPSGQDVSAGTYADTLTATVEP